MAILGVNTVISGQIERQNSLYLKKAAFFFV
jgi:hypothetical protein